MCTWVAFACLCRRVTRAQDSPGMNEPVERARRIQDKLLFIVAFSSRNCARRFPSAVGSSLGSFNLPLSRCAAEPAGKKSCLFGEWCARKSFRLGRDVLLLLPSRLNALDIPMSSHGHDTVLDSLAKLRVHADQLPQGSQTPSDTDEAPQHPHQLDGHSHLEQESDLNHSSTSDRLSLKSTSERVRREGYGFRPLSGSSTPNAIPQGAQTPLPDPNGLGWPAKSTLSRLYSTVQEREAREKKLSDAVRTLLECIGEDPDREGLKRTPERYAQALMWMTRGYEERLAGACFNARQSLSV